MSKKINSLINLENLAEGAFAEKLNQAIREVAENIQDFNTEATKTRGITVKISFKPNKDRHMIAVNITTTTSLAPSEAIGTLMVMGTNAKTGQVEISEFFDQLRGQITFDEMAQPAEDPEPIQEPEPAPDPGKPLDLRSRARKQEPAPGEMVPGRDFDPVTGELFENTQQFDDGRVIHINNKAVQA